MKNLNSETFIVPKKNIKFTIWEDNERLMMTCEHYSIVNFNPTYANQVRLVNLKRIFKLCRDERSCYSLGEVDETEFYIKVFSSGECRYINFTEYESKITVQFITKGLYFDKSDPEHWIERDYFAEVGEEHQLTCRDLYRIRKMCNISDIE